MNDKKPEVALRHFYLRSCDCLFTERNPENIEVIGARGVKSN